MNLWTDLLWYVRPGIRLPLRLVVVTFWGAVLAWATINCWGIVLGYVTSYFLRAGSCGLLLWDVLPRNAMFGLFPGTTSHGLLWSLLIWMYNLALGSLAVYAIGQNRARATSGKATASAYVVELFGLNVLLSLAAVAVLVVALILGGVTTSVVAHLVGNPNVEDLNIPGVCEVTPTR